MSNEHLFENIRAAIEWAALGIEILGAVIIVAGVLRVAITRWHRAIPDETRRAGRL